jgi:hypothetical protein
MENRITKKVESYLTEFKQDVKDWFDKNDTNMVGSSGNNSKSEFLQFIFDYNAINLSKEDFTKRKRVKNQVPGQLRCCAKRANGEQCTRRKKENEEYCGTHIKGTPNGKVDCDIEEPNLAKKRNIWVQEIKGIQYFIDEQGNVYNHGDVLGNKINPNIIAKYVKNGESYSIPEFCA